MLPGLEVAPPTLLHELSNVLGLSKAFMPDVKNHWASRHISHIKRLEGDVSRKTLSQLSHPALYKIGREARELNKWSRELNKWLLQQMEHMKHL